MEYKSKSGNEIERENLEEEESAGRPSPRWQPDMLERMVEALPLPNFATAFDLNGTPAHREDELGLLQLALRAETIFQVDGKHGHLQVLQTDLVNKYYI